jgi:hypothetical protein
MFSNYERKHGTLIHGICTLPVESVAPSIFAGMRAKRTGSMTIRSRGIGAGGPFIMPTEPTKRRRKTEKEHDRDSLLDQIETKEG